MGVSVGICVCVCVCVCGRERERERERRKKKEKKEGQIVEGWLGGGKSVYSRKELTWFARRHKVEEEEEV